MTNLVCSRATVTVNNVGSSLVQAAIIVPAKAKVRRVRANVVAGPAINQVALELRESVAGDNVLAYALAAEPLDSEEDSLLIPEDVTISGGSGTAYVFVKVDDATEAHQVEVKIDLDVAK